MRRDDRAAQIVELVIRHGGIVTAHSPFRGETTVGPYHEAVDRGKRFAVISYGRFGGMSSLQTEYAGALEAASAFVDRVGSTRANEAGRDASKRMGLRIPDPVEKPARRRTGSARSKR